MCPKRAIGSAVTGELDIQAKIVLPGQTRRAGQARDSGIDSNPLP
jgi:hypothetical protein